MFELGHFFGVRGYIDSNSVLKPISSAHKDFYRESSQRCPKIIKNMVMENAYTDATVEIETAKPSCAKHANT